MAIPFLNGFLFMAINIGILKNLWPYIEMLEYDKRLWDVYFENKNFIRDFVKFSSMFPWITAVEETFLVVRIYKIFYFLYRNAIYVSNTGIGDKVQGMKIEDTLR